MPWEEARKLIEIAITKNQQDKFWSLYCSIYPWFTEENFINFDEFCKIPQNIKSKEENKEEILEKVFKIIKEIG